MINVKPPPESQNAMIKVEYNGIVEDLRQETPDQMLDKKIKQEELKRKKSEKNLKEDPSLLNQFKDEIDQVYKE